MRYLLDTQGRVVAELPERFPDDRCSYLCVATAPGYQHAAAGCFVGRDGWRAWRLLDDVLDGSPIGLFHGEIRDPYWGGTYSDSVQYVGRVPPERERRRTWLTDEPACWECSTERSHRIVLTGTVLDAVADWPDPKFFGRRLGHHALIELDVYGRWRVWVGQVGLRPGLRVALSVLDGMAIVGDPRRIVPLASVSLPGLQPQLRELGVP